jgi:hypothetical protein
MNVVARASNLDGRRVLILEDGGPISLLTQAVGMG